MIMNSADGKNFTLQMFGVEGLYIFAGEVKTIHLGYCESFEEANTLKNFLVNNIDINSCVKDFRIANVTFTGKVK